MKSMNIVIAGVGGQGTLFASRVLGLLAQKLGLDVKVSEVHGMSQRGGSVVTYVRIGDKIYSPIVDPGTADYLLAFEELEALRYLPELKKGGLLVANAQRILPLPVMIGAAQYPAEIESLLQKQVETVMVDAFSLAKQAGNERVVNTVLLGVLAARLPIDKQLWLEVLDASVPARFREANMAAFELGYSYTVG